MFPDDQLSAIPPEGVSVGMKALILFGMMAVIFAIVFSKFFVTRGRSTTNGKGSSAFSVASSMTSEQDRAIAYQAEQSAIQEMMDFLEDARENNLISSTGFVKAKRLLQADLLLVEQSLDELQRKRDIQLLDIQREEEDFSDLEADLQSRLEQDPFVPTQPQRTEKFDAPIPPTRRTTPQPPAQSSIPAPQPPTQSSIPAPQPPAQSSIPAPQPPTQSSIPAPQPPAQSSIPAPQPPAQSSIPAPQPPAQSSIPAPRPPTQSTSIPPPEPPKANRPVIPSAEQPVMPKPQTDESKFAKTTSIAALRMDMLKELARLKKYINEDEQ